MCEYVNNNICKILNNNCPYMYFCNKDNIWKANKYMPKNCKIKEKLDIPEGYYKVCFEKRGNLYIDYNGHIEIIPNPFDNTPLYVKLTKLKNGKWKLKRYEGC